MQMEWLKILKDEMYEITRAGAFELFPPIGTYGEPYHNHRFEHVKPVEKEALKLLAFYSEADKEVVLAAVWIHDRCKPQFKGPDHHNRAADWAAQNLGDTGFPKEKVAAVEYAVRNHAGWTKKPLDTLESKIVWDSDKLAHIGPNYLFQTFFIFTCEKIVNNETQFEIKFNPTISLDIVMPALARMHSDFDYEKPFHLDETWQIYKEKQMAVNALIEALQNDL